MKNARGSSKTRKINTHTKKGQEKTRGKNKQKIKEKERGARRKRRRKGEWRGRVKGKSKRNKRSQGCPSWPKRLTLRHEENVDTR